MVAPVTVSVLVITAIATFLAFQKRELWEQWMFKPYEILRHKEVHRMFTSALIHLDWMHFFFNAYTFYSFGRNVEFMYGGKTLLIIYLASILGGSLLSLLIHRHHDYSALGASGGVCGVMFASIFLLPGGRLSPFMLPIPMPAYLYAILFLVLSFIALRRRADNIGHDAHLGGAIVGLLVATAMYPRLVLAAPRMFAAVLGLSIVILCLLAFDPLALWKHFFEAGEGSGGMSRLQVYEFNRRRNRKLAEIDRLLDKVGQKGIHSLSNSERKKLDQLSREVGRR